MRLSEYLKSRVNGHCVNALTRKEAMLCNIPWPLRKGWAIQFSDLEVDEVAMREIVAQRKARREEARSARTKTQRGLAKEQRRDARRLAKIEKRKARAEKKIATGRKVYENTDAFLASYEWRVVRMKALKRDGARCACCGSTPSDGVKMHVDHIKPRKTHPELALDLANLQVLCEVCNHGKGNWDSTDWRRKPAANDVLEDEQASHIRSIVHG